MSAAERTLDAGTRLAVNRTRLAYERTLMAWVRTAASMISFGFTIYKFFQLELKDQAGCPALDWAARVHGAFARSASSGVSGATETPSAVLSSRRVRRRVAARRLLRRSLRRASRSASSRCRRARRRASRRPGPASATRLRSVLVSCTGWPLNDWMTSPRLTPARSAALPGATELTIAPPACFSPRLSAMSDVTGCTRDAELRARTSPVGPQLVHDVAAPCSPESRSRCRCCRRTATGSAS